MYPYKAKLSEELDHSKFYRGKLVGPGTVVDIQGPGDEAIFEGYLTKFHEETAEEKEAAIAKPIFATFTPGASGFANLSNEFKTPKTTPTPTPTPEPTPEPTPDPEPVTPKAEPETKPTTSKAGDKKK